MELNSSAWMTVYEILGDQQLSNIEELVFSECWHNRTYEDIANQHGYDANYLRAVGAGLWHKLSIALDAKVSKNSLRSVITRYQRLYTGAHSSTAAAPAASPHGPLPLDSNYYLARPVLEKNCYQEIAQSGQLLRIRGPKRSGKTSLLLRLVEQAQKHQMTACLVDCHLADSTVMTSLKKFLQWFCLTVGRNIGVENRLDNFWEDFLGANSVTTDYFGEYLLKEVKSPLVLVLDNADVIFQYPKIAQDFYGLLRSWYEQSRYGFEHKQSWQKLRLVLSYSTSDYVMMNIHQSPLNVGALMELPPFSLAETRQLVEQYNIQYDDENLHCLNHWLGGQPYLLQILLNCLKQSQISWGDIVSNERSADRLQAIYGQHLRRLLQTLNQKPNLLQVYQEILSSSQLMHNYADEIFQLSSMGLVVLMPNQVRPSCQLYSHYFSQFSLNKDPGEVLLNVS